MEARRRATDEGCDALHLLLLAQSRADGVGHSPRLSQSRTCGQRDLYGKLVAVGHRHHAHTDMRLTDDDTDEDESQRADNGPPRTVEGPREHPLVVELYIVGERFLLVFLRHGLDEEIHHDGQHHDSQQQTDHQVDEDGPGQILHNVEQRTLHDEEEWEVDDRYAKRGQRHWHEVVRHRLYGGIPSIHAFAEILQIAVEHHNGIVNHHTQHQNQSGQRDDMQRNAYCRHDCDADERGQRHNDTCHQCRAPREEQQHNHDDDSHRLQEVDKEVSNALFYHLALVCDAADGDVLGQVVRGEFVEHRLHVLTHVDDILTLSHLHREQYAGVGVILNIAR